jgi:hypothetical protein
MPFGIAAFGLYDLLVYHFTVRVFGNRVVATARETDVILPRSAVRGFLFSGKGDAGIVAAIPLRHDIADCTPADKRQTGW